MGVTSLAFLLFCATVAVNGHFRGHGRFQGHWGHRGGKMVAYQKFAAANGLRYRHGDCPGNDIRSMTRTNLQGCANLCKASRGCVAFLWNEQGQCYVKRKTCANIDARNKMNRFFDKGHISGHNWQGHWGQWRGHTAHCTYTFQNADCGGHDIYHGRHNRAQCRSLCTKRRDCKSFQQRGGSCWLKNYVCTPRQLTYVHHRGFAQFTKHCGGRWGGIGRFRWGRQLRFNFRLGGWINLAWFRNLKACPSGTRPYRRRCRVINFNLYRIWLRRNGGRFGINLGRYSWIGGYVFRYYRLLRLNYRLGGFLNLAWFRGLKGCMPGTKRDGARCRIFNLSLVRSWMGRFARRFHINIARAIPLLHHFRFTGATNGQWGLKLYGGARYVQGKYLYLPGNRGAFALFRRIAFQGSFTIGFYVKPLRVNGRQTLIGSWVRNRWLYKFNLINGRLSLWLRGPHAGTALVTVGYSGRLVANRWYHVAFTWNAANRWARIFINGRQVGARKSNTPRSVNLFSNPGLTAIGYKQDSNNGNLKAYITGLRISRGVTPASQFLIYARKVSHFRLHLQGFRYFTLLRRNLRIGGNIHLRWFRYGRFKLTRCPQGTRRGRSGCRIYRIRLFLTWLRAHGPRYKINISKLPALHKVWPLKPSGKIYGHPWYLLFRIGRPAATTGIRQVPGPFGSKQPGYYFPGKPNAFFRIPNNGHLHFKSFTIFAWIKQNGIHNGAIVEYSGFRKQGAGTHFWIWGNTLFINLIHNNGRSYQVSFPKFKGMFPKNKWSFVGASYNHVTGYLVMWINGRTITRKPGRVVPDTVGPVYVGIRPKNRGFSPFKGTLSGVSILPYAIAQNKVINFIHYYLKLTGGKAPAVFFHLTPHPKPVFPQKYFTLLLKQVRPGGIIHLSWFHRSHCFPGTVKVGNACRIRRIRIFIRWLRRTGSKFKINLGKLPAVNKVWPLRPAGKIFGHPWYLLFLQTRPPGAHIIKRGHGPFGSRQPGYYFPGKSNAFFRIPNNGHLHFKSFTIFAWIKQNGIHNGAIVEYSGFKKQGAGTHFWIWGNTLFINLIHNNGRSYQVSFPKFKGMFPKNKWSFVGVSYNHVTGYLVMWINERTITRKPGRVVPDTVGDVYVGVRPKNKKYSPFKGTLSGVSILPYAVAQNAVRHFIYYYLRLTGGRAPAGFFKVPVVHPPVVKPPVKPPVVVKPPVKPPVTKPAGPPPAPAPTTLSKANLKNGGRFNLGAIFKGLSACPSGTKAVGNACQIVNYQIFIGWLKVHATTYHINLATLPIVYTTTTTTTMHFNKGQQFDILMFKGKCPTGTKTVGKKCEVTSADAFLAWLKINAKSYGIDFSVHEGPAAGGSYTSSTSTQTTQSGGGFALGQQFPKAMFRGSCVSGTKASGDKCVLTNGNQFKAWLDKNGKAYGISFSG